MEPLLEALELVLVRGGRRILDGASIAIAPGELVAIEGASGSGKSTFLRSLATLIEPDSGTVRLRGQDARAIAPPAFRTRVAYVPQEPPMFDGLVGWNLAIGPSLRGEALDAERTAQLLDAVQLGPEYASREARSLSGGERARVALARALANKPEALLLDEPTAALDPATGARIVELARRLADRGRSVVMVTHDSEHATALQGTRYVFEAGRLRRPVP